MANAEWCRHYKGRAFGEQCAVGLYYDDFRIISPGGAEWACTTPGYHRLCPSFEAWTQAEIDEHEQRVNAWLEKVSALDSGKSDICPHCNQQITSMKQVGRCVYGSCGCRLWQGQIPSAWSAAK